MLSCSCSYFHQKVIHVLIFPCEHISDETDEEDDERPRRRRRLAERAADGDMQDEDEVCKLC